MIDRYTMLKTFFKYYDMISPPLPESLDGRISIVSLHFINENKGASLTEKIRKSISNNFLFDTNRYRENSSATGNDNTVEQKPSTLSESKEELRNRALKDNFTEGTYERYFNLISNKKLVVLVLCAVVLQILESLTTYLKFGNYVFMRDFGITTELIVTVIGAFIVFFFPLATSRAQVIYIFILLLTNNMTRLMWEDWFPPYEPSFQIFLWINFSLPTAKFSRSIWTGSIAILVLVIIRLCQHYASVVDVVIAEGGAYLLYQISIGFGSRNNEIYNRALFAELVELDPFSSAVETWKLVQKHQNNISNNITLKFKSKTLEKEFQAYYSKESVVVLSVVLSTVVTSIYYVFQDHEYAKNFVLFACLRFLVIVPATFALLYFSIIRREKPLKADLYTLISLILVIAVNTLMFTQCISRDGALYYFGGVMRAGTLASAQLFFLFFSAIVPFSLVIIPVSLIVYSLDDGINYAIFVVVFLAVAMSYSYQREQTQRLRFLVKYYGQEILLANKITTNSENNNMETIDIINTETTDGENLIEMNQIQQHHFNQNDNDEDQIVDTIVLHNDLIDQNQNQI